MIELKEEGTLLKIQKHIDTKTLDETWVIHYVDVVGKPKSVVFKLGNPVQMETIPIT